MTRCWTSNYTKNEDDDDEEKTRFRKRIKVIRIHDNGDIIIL